MQLFNLPKTSILSDVIDDMLLRSFFQSFQKLAALVFGCHKTQHGVVSFIHSSFTANACQLGTSQDFHTEQVIQQTKVWFSDVPEIRSKTNDIGQYA